MVPAFCRKVAGNPFERVKFHAQILFGPAHPDILLVNRQKRVFTFPQDDYDILSVD